MVEACSSTSRVLQTDTEAFSSGTRGRLAYEKTDETALALECLPPSLRVSAGGPSTDTFFVLISVPQTSLLGDTGKTQTKKAAFERDTGVL